MTHQNRILAYNLYIAPFDIDILASSKQSEKLVSSIYYDSQYFSAASIDFDIAHTAQPAAAFHAYDFLLS